MKGGRERSYQEAGNRERGRDGKTWKGEAVRLRRMGRKGGRESKEGREVGRVRRVGR